MAEGCIHSHTAYGATNAALTWTPAADAEIQPYKGQAIAKALSFTANVSAVTLATRAQLSIAQEAAYAGIYSKVTQQNDGVVATGDPPSQPHTMIGKVLLRDMDMTSTPDGPGSDTSAIMVHMRYGRNIKVKSVVGKRIQRKITGTGDDAATGFTAFAGGSLNDLNPSREYGIISMTPIIQDQAGIGVKISAPSLEGLEPGVLYAGGGVRGCWLDEDGDEILAGIVTGSETITLKSMSHSAQTPVVLLELIEIGVVEAAPTGVTPGVPGGGGISFRQPGNGGIQGFIGGGGVSGGVGGIAQQLATSIFGRRAGM